MPAAHSLVKQILVNSPLDRWSYQGFGMLRLYLPDDCRLHIWLPESAVDQVSTIHNHPWDFKSYIIVGKIQNVRYHQLQPPFTSADAVIRNMATIQCGMGGCQKEPAEQVKLIRGNRETYVDGQNYSQRAEELHETVATPGTVTIIERKAKGPDRDHAQVAWPVGEDWVSAEPRPATAEEHEKFLGAAFALLGPMPIKSKKEG